MPQHVPRAHGGWIGPDRPGPADFVAELWRYPERAVAHRDLVLATRALPRHGKPAAGALDAPAVLHGLACVGPGANAEKGDIDDFLARVEAAAKRDEAGASSMDVLKGYFKDLVSATHGARARPAATP